MDDVKQVLSKLIMRCELDFSRLGQGPILGFYEYVDEPSSGYVPGGKLLPS